MSNFRRSGSFNLSPRKIFATPNAVVTPSTRRQSFNTSSNSILFDGSGNNDEAEKRERQLNRLHQLQSRGVHSPTATPGDRKKSMSSFSGLTNQQLTEHYAKCIQLSAENKINVKNAFNLQLIDYMTELLKRKDSDMNNFQVASCTLDASTKIYSYRVDSVHTDTLKMAGGLGRTKDKPEDNPGDALGDDEYEENHPRGKKRAKSKKCATIESNLKNLDVAHFDLAFDVDPLFKKTATQFDEGTVGGGQFLNTLHILDERSQLVLDSDAVPNDLEKENQNNENQTTFVITSPEINSKVICNTFSGFEFTTWNLSDDTFRNSLILENENENDHAFDINAVPEPLDDLEQEPFEADDMTNIPDDDNMDMGDNTVITIGREMACNQSDRPPPPQLEVIHLKHYLSENPLEYSYFDSRVMSAWAGPGHWKLKPLIKGNITNKEGNKLREKQKKEFSLEFYLDPEIEKHFATSRAATKLSQLTVKKWNITTTTTPLDLHYDPSEFCKLYLRVDISIRKQEIKQESEIKKEEIDELEHGNENNAPLDGDDGSNYGDNTALPGYDDTDLFSQTVFPSQPNGEEDQHKDFLGDNLVEAPNKVSLVNIGYARTAKKMDMRKLKTAIWGLLGDPDCDKENDRNRQLKDRVYVKESKEFSNLYSELHPRLPPKMTENLSVPLAFIALLHLANEQCLKLTSISGMGDFIISQG